MYQEWCTAGARTGGLVGDARPCGSWRETPHSRQTAIADVTEGFAPTGAIGVWSMDFLSGARRVVVAMTHTAKSVPKIVPCCTLPLTSVRRVSLIVTEMAVVEPSEQGLVLRERAPGVEVGAMLAPTEAPLRVDGDVPEMSLETTG
jgi:hypothetical protein